MNFKYWLESLDPEKMINDYENQKRYILHYGKIPKNVETNMNKSQYYTFITDKIEQIRNNPNLHKTFYHGSNSVFDKFDLKYVGSASDNFQEGPGFYFTSSLEEAKHFGKYVKKYFLHIKKAVPLTGKMKIREVKFMIQNAPDYLEDLTNFDEDPRKAFDMAVMSYSQHDPHDGFQTIWNDFYKNENSAYLLNMIKLKYDGVIKPNNSTTHVIVFNPNVIESTID